MRALRAFSTRLKLALVLGVVTPAIAIVLLLQPAGTHGAVRTTYAAAHAAPPTAADFAGDFVGVGNQYAQEHGDAARLADAHCAEAASGRYMCSYVVEKPGAPKACHLMQASWTPDGASSFEVTLTGRTGRCSSLQEAIRTLR